MADLSILAGATSQSINVDLYVLASGAPQTALVYNSTGLTAYYSFTGANATAHAITLATLAGVTSAWSSGGFIKLDDTNMPGLYRLDLPDAAIAASKGRECIVTITGFSGMATRHIKIELTGWDNQDGVRGGMTALPNAAAAASGGLPILGANATLISFTAGMVISNAGGDALQLTSSGSNGNGLKIAANGSGAGINVTPGATGTGILAIGGATSGSAMKLTGTAGNAIALEIAGQGSAAGMSVTGGGTGIGLKIVGGGTSGNGLDITTTSGHGISSVATGTTKHGIVATGGATTSHGISATGGGVGHGILATSGGGATGDGIQAISTATNGNGVNFLGKGSGAGEIATGGLTGPGANWVGGGTSGDGLLVTTTAGHGFNIAATGTSKHGITSTGGNGGTSDGVKCVAGTGGVDLRANITGDITGTLATLTTYTGNTVQTGDAYARLGVAGAGLTAITGVTLASGQKVDVDTIKTNPVVNAGTVTFPTNATLASTANITGGTITTVTNLTNAATAGDLTTTMKTSVENAVWDATLASHLGAGSTGNALNAAGAAGDPWSTAIPGAYGAGTAGHRLGSLPDVTAGAAGGVFIAGTNAATTITTGLTTTFTGNLTGSVASVTAGVTVTTNNDKTGYSLTQAFPANFSALGITGGGHLANVDTLTTYTGNTPQTGDNYALLNGADSEPAAVPAANATPIKKLGWLYTLGRNKMTQTATTATLRNNADAGTIATSAVSDDGVTFLRGIWT